MKKEGFEGWNQWKERNKEGIECELSITKRGNKITMTTENLGIYIQETLIPKDSTADVYVAITGDQCALTDIRILG